MAAHSTFLGIQRAQDRIEDAELFEARLRQDVMVGWLDCLFPGFPMGFFFRGGKISNLVRT